jgi:hypothetical protein
MIASNLNFQRDWVKIPFFEIYPFDFIITNFYHSVSNVAKSEYRFFINCYSDFNSEISKASFEKNGTIGKSHYYDSGIASNRIFSIVHDFNSWGKDESAAFVAKLPMKNILQNLGIWNATANFDVSYLIVDIFMRVLKFRFEYILNFIQKHDILNNPLFRVNLHIPGAIYEDYKNIIFKTKNSYFFRNPQGLSDTGKYVKGNLKPEFTLIPLNLDKNSKDLIALNKPFFDYLDSFTLKSIDYRVNLYETPLLTTLHRVKQDFKLYKIYNETMDIFLTTPGLYIEVNKAKCCKLLEIMDINEYKELFDFSSKGFNQILGIKKGIE